MRRSMGALATLALPLALLLGACGQGQAGSAPDTAGTSTTEPGTVTLYSGRDEKLVGPIIDRFRAETGVNVEVRYGNSAEMAAQLAEEGEATPADVFYSQEVGAVGALARRDLMGQLPQATIDRVAPQFRPAADRAWVGVTARSRVLVYNEGALGDAPAPTGMEGLTDPAYRDLVGLVPGNAGFQAAMTGFRVSRGEPAAEQWLRDMKTNGVNTGYESNGDLLEAVGRGDQAIGLINHYYWARQEPAERDRTKIVFPTSDDPGGLVNATAAGVTKKGETNPAAVQLIDYLLSETGQQAFVDETWEYPVVPGIEGPADIPPLAELGGPKIDLTDLDSLEQTQAMLTREGYLS
ncbi:iron(III) transport system substrate-binding protein [Naumannella cuiyingiana]|uniref:Iron(III) transport system substrate-binding protein n=1 Tax=Naumannella cuiyingiana TaxID=1347891 RepID=A0A7Z0D8X9_9ACTN|nr:extracellular solute-binding protein [Naumannella cuiyingiana]NYI71144.1 iron(III) transport system substrate-binding protein [Naumannella cuiyingiana]